MKAVILAAGEGKRMRPLTFTRPKPLLRVANKPILHHTLEQIKKVGIDEVIVVVGYMWEQIKNYFGEEFQGIKINYVLQKEQLGTGHALLQAKDLLRNEEKFLVLYGDDIYSSGDMEKCIRHDMCVSAKKVEDPERFGVFILEGNKVLDLIEKPSQFVSDIANTGMYVFDKEIFNFIQSEKSIRGEIELTDYVKRISSVFDVDCEIVENWIPIGYPWDLLTANEEKLKDIKSFISDGAKIESNVSMDKEVFINSNVRIRSGVYIEGPCFIGEGSDIGPNCYIRSNTTIGKNCRIGNGSEIKNVIVDDNTHISHLSYVADSLIGKNCNFGAGTIVANLRHDNKPIKVLIKGELKDTRRRKFGIVMGDYCKTGIGTMFYPGMILGPFSWTSPNSTVNKNLEPFRLFDGEKKLIEKDKIESAIKEEKDKEFFMMLFDKLREIDYG
ncbi:MAG: sugar phosphate nucleotidyltransferase [Candidatus Aenigmatarchaeota archaeon]